MRFEPPPFADGATPMPISRILAVPHLQLYPPDDGSQLHLLFSPVMGFASIEGEKLRLGGLPLLGAFAPTVGASIRALLPKLPSLFRAESAAGHYPSSLVLSYVVYVSRNEEPFTTPTCWKNMVGVSRCARTYAMARPTTEPERGLQSAATSKLAR